MCPKSNWGTGAPFLKVTDTGNRHINMQKNRAEPQLAHLFTHEYAMLLREQSASCAKKIFSTVSTNSVKVVIEYMNCTHFPKGPNLA